MTNDDGRKPEGAPERSPTAGAVPLRGLMGMASVALVQMTWWSSGRRRARRMATLLQSPLSFYFV
jgi:hypothetical protein